MQLNAIAPTKYMVMHVSVCVCLPRCAYKGMGTPPLSPKELKPLQCANTIANYKTYNNVYNAIQCNTTMQNAQQPITIVCGIGVLVDGGMGGMGND